MVVIHIIDSRFLLVLLLDVGLLLTKLRKIFLFGVDALCYFSV